jgi:hypothetical protein
VNGRKIPYGRRPPYHRRDRLGFWPTMWLSLFGIIMAYAVMGASHAHATPVVWPVDVCAELRARGSISNIETELRGWGLSDRAAGIYTGAQVRALCPELIGYTMGQLI